MTLLAWLELVSIFHRENGVRVTFLSKKLLSVFLLAWANARVWGQTDTSILINMTLGRIKSLFFAWHADLKKNKQRSPAFDCVSSVTLSWFLDENACKRMQSRKQRMVMVLVFWLWRYVQGWLRYEQEIDCQNRNSEKWWRLLLVLCQKCIFSQISFTNICAMLFAIIWRPKCELWPCHDRKIRCPPHQPTLLATTHALNGMAHPHKLTLICNWKMWLESKPLIYVQTSTLKVVNFSDKYVVLLAFRSFRDAFAVQIFPSWTLIWR